MSSTGGAAGLVGGEMQWEPGLSGNDDNNGEAWTRLTPEKKIPWLLLQNRRVHWVNVYF